MRSAGGQLAGLLGIVILALCFRVPELGRRPMHTDEAVHGILFGRILEHGFYRYNPHDYHGPTLHYFSLLPAWLCGASDVGEVTESMLRVVPLVFGVGLILLLWLMRDAMGGPGLMAAGLLTAVSPSMVYFSRYYIQEMLLVFFTFGLFCCAWRYCRQPRSFWAILSGLFAALVHTTKETSVMAFFAMALACLVTWLLRGRPGLRAVPWRIWKHVGLAVGVALSIWLLFYSSMFTNLRGPLDNIISYVNFSGRAGGHGHAKPWTYYVSLLFWHREQGLRVSELLIFALALVGSCLSFHRYRFERLSPARQPDPVSLRRRQTATLGLFLTAYGIILFFVYAVIPYKTPWLMLSVTHAAILLAGTGVTKILRRVKGRYLRLALAAALLLGVWDLAAQARLTSYRYAADDRNPYAYSHTAPDCLRLVERLRVAAAAHPDGVDMTVKVISEEYWPLPWYLRDFTRVGYWTELPADPRAPVVVASVNLSDAVEAALGEGYTGDLKGLRPEVMLLTYYRDDLWRFIVEGGRPAPTDEAPAPAKEEASMSVHSHAHYAMGTTFELQIAHPDEDYAAGAAKAAFGLLDRLHGLLSHYDANSEISHIGLLQPGERYRVSDEVQECLLLAQRMSRKTGGHFDPALGALTANAELNGEDRTAALARSGMDQIEILPETHEVTVRVAGLKLDLGGIGKGFALDRMAALLEEWDITNVFLQAATSTVLGRGAKPGEAGWPVGWTVRDQRERVLLHNRAMSSSGTAFKGAHVLDPVSGESVTNRVRTWALAPSAGMADALSTAFMVMPDEAIASFCQAHPDTQAMVLGRGEAAALQRFGGRVSIADADRGE